MSLKINIEDFLSQKTIAVAGVSRNRNKFGNIIFRELEKKGYKVIPVNPNAENLESRTCYPNMASLPEVVDALVCVVPSSESAKVTKEAYDSGVKRIWFQQGSESQESIAFCHDKGIPAIYNQCILMYVEPTGGIHKFHRWIWKIFGKLPK